MKKIYVILSLVFTTLMIGCSITDEVENGNMPGTYVIKLPDNVDTGARGVEAPIGTELTTAINDATVYLMSGNAVTSIETFTTQEISEKKKRINDVPASVNNVILLANNRGEVTAPLTTATGIRFFPFTIAKQNDVAGIAEKTHIGEAVPVPGTDPQGASENKDYKEVDITLKSITSRLEIGAVKAGEGIASIELVSLYINNYYTDGSKAAIKFHDTDDGMWVTNETTGSSTTAFTGAITTPAYTDPSYKLLADNTQVTLTENSRCYAFQVFSGNIPHVIMLVKGEYEDEYVTEGKKYFLGWVTFTKYKDTGGQYITAMDPHNIYKMGLGTEGITIDAEDITDKPEKRIFDLTITVTVAPWSTVKVTPEV